MGTPSSPGAPTPWRGMGAGDWLSKTPGDGGFFWKSPGGFRGILCNKNGCFYWDFALESIFLVPLRVVITSLLGVNTCLFYNMSHLCSKIDVLLQLYIKNLFKIIFGILLLYIPRPPGDGGFFFSKSPGVPGAGGFFHPESPGAPGPGDFFQPRGMPSLPWLMHIHSSLLLSYSSWKLKMT